MKKLTILFVVTVISLCVAVSVDAKTKRFRVGVKGGVNSTEANFSRIIDAGFSPETTGFNAGLVLNVRLFLGFSIQPELVYTESKQKFELFSEVSQIQELGMGSRTTRMIELPVNLQWGLRIGPIRPFAQISPYIGYIISETAQIEESNANIDGGNFQFGVGLGFGLDIWKLQLSYKYKWKVKNLGDNLTVKGLTEGLQDAQGSEISIAFLF